MTAAPTAERLAVLDSLWRSRSLAIDNGKVFSRVRDLSQQAGDTELESVAIAAQEYLLGVVRLVSEYLEHFPAEGERTER